MRLVWMKPTGSGDDVWERRAEAAAAEDSRSGGDCIKKGGARCWQLGT